MTTTEPVWPFPSASARPRTEKEIDETLAALKAVWMRHPGMRLTQVVTFIAKVDYSTEDLDKIPSFPSEIKYDHTYVSDRDWVEKSLRYPH